MTVEGRMMKNDKAVAMSRPILAVAAVAALAAALVMGPGCGGKEKTPAYEAEKDLFDARKRASELTFPTLNREFLDRTLAAYRKIIEVYSGETGEIEGMDLLVVTAQMELAELEFRASMFEDARKDFLRAYEIAGNVPAARANALWSAAFISSETGDSEKALELFSRFYEEYLSGGQLLDTARLNRRYILTPIRIAEIYRAREDSRLAEEWLGKAGKIYMDIISSDVPEDIRKEARYNLVSAYLLSEKWTEARETIREMQKMYEDQADIPSLLYLEARVELDGFDDSESAINVFDRIIEGYPGSKEAPTALLMKGNILLDEERYDEAAEAYDGVLKEYGDSGPEAVEAQWQLAILEERRDNWVEASLHYKSVYTDYPATLQGMEAPLRIAAHYRETGEAEALAAAYERAAEHYERLSSTQYSDMVRIVAEEYTVRALIEQRRWEEAATLLLTLPGEYPQYHRFKGNCLMAASIYENELGDPARAAEVLRDCAAAYPDTPVADEALKQCERIMGSR